MGVGEHQRTRGALTGALFGPLVRTQLLAEVVHGNEPSAALDRPELLPWLSLVAADCYGRGRQGPVDLARELKASVWPERRSHVGQGLADRHQLVTRAQ